LHQYECLVLNGVDILVHVSGMCMCIVVSFI